MQNDVSASNDGQDTMGHHVYKAQPLHVVQDPPTTPSSQPRPASYHHDSIYGTTRTWTTTESPTRSRQQLERQHQLQSQQRQQQPPLPNEQQQQQQQQHLVTSRKQIQSDMYAITSGSALNAADDSTAPNIPADAVSGNKDSSNKPFSSRTYHSIKDLISSRFGKTGKESADLGLLNNSGTVGYSGISGAGEKSQTQAMTPTTPTTLRQQLDSSRREGVSGSTYRGRGVPEEPSGTRDSNSVYRAQAGPAQRSYRYEDDTCSTPRTTDPHSHGLYGTTRYGANPNMAVSPYQRVPERAPEPIYQRYPAKQPPGPAQQGSSNSSVSSPQTLLREHGVYMAMPVQGFRPAPGPGAGSGAGPGGGVGAGPESTPARRGSVDLVEQPKPEEPSKSVTYGGGLYQVVHEKNGTREVFVDQESNYGRTTSNKGAEPANASRRNDEDDDEGGFIAERTRQSASQNGGHCQSGHCQSGHCQSGHCQSATSSDYEKARQSDSGRGSTVYSSGPRSKTAESGLDTSTELAQSPGSHPCEWVDMVESELRQILDNSHGNTTTANSTLSESISSMTPPLPPLSPSPGASRRYGHSQSLPYGCKPDYSLLEHSGKKSGGGPHGRSGAHVTAPARSWRPGKKKELASKSAKIPLSTSLGIGLDADLTSNTTGLDLDSMLDGATNTEENNTSEEDEDLSTTVGASGADSHAIRKQLEGLEGMYSEVLKLLGVRRQRPGAGPGGGHGGHTRYQPSDPRVNRRRLYGSLSSLPSSVSSRPVRDRRRHDERKKVKDIEGVNKRFQRLESHVVTLARSVAHLSSEMRTQHLMIREMEHIRSEMANLRTQTNMMAARSQSQSVPRGLNQLLADRDPRRDRLRDPAAITNPSRVKKLTKFFGDEPPLLRLFLKKLGYEKYASAFEQERVGMVELPYMTEERLQKMGIPMGPRLRILQEAQISACRDTVYVV